MAGEGWTGRWGLTVANDYYRKKINHEVLLFSRGNDIQYLLINHSENNMKKYIYNIHTHTHTYICIERKRKTESHLVVSDSL